MVTLALALILLSGLSLRRSILAEMKGTLYCGLYKALSEKFRLDITASGGVSSMEDIRQLRKMDLYGAIIGKAYYTGAIDLKEALEVSK